MAFSQYFATQVLGWVKGAPFPTALSNVYISLHTSDPGTAGTSGDVTNSITNSNPDGIAYDVAYRVTYYIANGITNHSTNCVTY